MKLSRPARLSSIIMMIWLTIISNGQYTMIVRGCQGFKLVLKRLHYAAAADKEVSV